MTLFETSVDSIESEYKRLGYGLGWRFLMVPAETLHLRARTLVLTLNPGGDWEPPEHPRAQFPGGSAYRLESWPDNGKSPSRYPAGKAPFQLQVQAMFRWLGEDIDATPTGCFVPFRSPRWKELRRRDEALSFARKLWTPLLSALQPRLILCIGVGDTFANIYNLIGAQPGSQFPLGWGNYTAKTASTASTKVIGLPHLSIFRIFDRPESDAALACLRDFI